MTRWIALLAAVMLLVGCHGIVKKEFDAEGNSSMVKIGDPALKGLVEIVQTSSEYVDGNMTVKVMIHNKTHLRREIEWKIVFSDEQGFPLDDPWGWRPLSLEPKGDEVIVAKSLNKQASSFEVQLQRASMEDMR